MLNREISFIGIDNYTTPTTIVNRQFTNNTDIDVIIYTLNNKLTHSDRVILLKLIDLQEKHPEIRVTHPQLALYAKSTLISARRAIKKLLTLGYMRRWKTGGPYIYVICNEILSVRYVNIKNKISFHLDNEQEINYEYNIYIHNNGRQSAHSASPHGDLSIRVGENPHKGGSVSVEIVESYIKPYVESIKDIELDDQQKRRLSQFPLAVISKSLWIMKKSPRHRWGFHYLFGICNKASGNNTNKGKWKAKFRFENDPVTGQAHIINLAEEAHDEMVINFHKQRHVLENYTATSDLYDYVKRREVGLPATNKAAAEQEIVNLMKSGITVTDFMECFDATPSWIRIKDDSHARSAHIPSLSEEWDWKVYMYREHKKLKDSVKDFLYKQSDEYLFQGQVDEIMEANEMWLFEQEWNRFTNDTENTSMPLGDAQLKVPHE